MIDLSTRYLGLELPSPIVVSSSGLTRTQERVRLCAEAGAGAVVLKSLFEEQIEAQVGTLADGGHSPYMHPEAMDYITRYGEEDAVDSYLRLIRDAKATVEIPVIASVHCVSAGTWTDFARRVEDAGADAIELNLFLLPSDPRRNGREYEQVTFDIADAVTSKVSIPVALKVGPHYSGMMQLLLNLSRSGIAGLTLFNRFFQLDFDINDFTVVPARIFSHPEEIAVPLRWISILSWRAGCDLAATTGVHDAEGVIKQLLAGAAAVQVCSAVYQKGIRHIGTMLDGVREWMEKQGFATVAEFRGRMSQRASDNPAAYERVQFMKSTTGVE